jgi:hypothetical protein
MHIFSSAVELFDKEDSICHSIILKFPRTTEDEKMCIDEITALRVGKANELKISGPVNEEVEREDQEKFRHDAEAFMGKILREKADTTQVIRRDPINVVGAATKTVLI